MADGIRFEMPLFFDMMGAVNRYRGLVRSQYWSEDELHSYRTNALGRVLREAGKIPFYANRWDGRPRPDDLAKLPTLSRRDTGELNRSVMSLYPDGVRHSSHSSSGSTGTPAEFLFDASHQRGRFAARMRYLRAHGWTPLRRTAWLIYNVIRTENEDERLMQSRLRMRSHIIAATPGLDDNLAQLCELDPTFLYTFPSYLEVLLNRLAETGRKLSSLRKIFTGAEVLEDSLRQRTKAALGLEIAENYGSTEAFMAWQCEAGNQHVNAEHVMLEIVDDDGHAVAPGHLGKVLVTTLENRLAPLVRYEIGDYAIAAAGKCACARTLPMIGRIVGRGMNLFRLPNGQLISPWPLSSAVRTRREVKQFQIVQNTVTRFTVHFVAERPLFADAEEVIRRGFREVLGEEVSIDFRRVPEVARTSGGKYMTALSELAN